MTLPLNPETLAAAYEYLCTTPPFSRWNLPESEDVVFKVGRDLGLRGWYTTDRGKHVIVISSGCIKRTESLLATMAHELVHLHQGDVKMDRPGVEHNAAFKKLAERVCKFHGWDVGLF